MTTRKNGTVVFNEVDKLNAILDIIYGNETEVPESELIEFCKKKIAQNMKKKSTGKRSDLANSPYRQAILEVLEEADEGMTVTEIVKAIGIDELTVHKATPVLRHLMNDEETGVVNERNGKKSLYFISR